MSIVRLEPGEVSVTLKNGRDLKDCDWFGKQDPYVVLTCGNKTFKSNVHIDGGVSPVWNQKFTFLVEQETEIELKVWDQDNFTPDDCIGKGKLELVSIRNQPGIQKDLEVPLIRRLSRRQKGFLAVSVKFTPRPTSQAQPAHGPNAYGAGTSVPDTVPKYEPTCGLIEPNADQLLPCHRSVHQPLAPAVQPVSTAPPGTSSGGGAYPPAAGPSVPFHTPMPPHANSFSHAYHTAPLYPTPFVVPPPSFYPTITASDGAALPPQQPPPPPPPIMAPSASFPNDPSYLLAPPPGSAAAYPFMSYPTYPGTGIY